jgi:quercetin dioxygenase-like cupin family protein
MTDVKRRDFIVGGAAGALAGTAAGLHPALAATGASGSEPIRGEYGATILGPRNEPLERENPDQLAPPSTDNGLVPNLKFSFDAAHTRLTDGGWAREVTARELPVATEMAGVDMRLKPGAIRELHWHLEAEWAFMLAGSARLTAVDQEGRNFIADVEAGDLWYFPPGIPHSIQGLADGCEFLLVFDDGNFGENHTFLLSGGVWVIQSVTRRFPRTWSSNATSSPARSRRRCVQTPCARHRAPCLAASSSASRIRRPSVAAGVRCGSWIHRSSVRPPRSRPRSWTSSPAGSASFTGTRTPTSGSTGSRGAGA